MSYFNNREYDKSIIELSKAEPVARLSDSLYLGFVKVLQANIYSINYNEAAELAKLEEALAIYTHLKEDHYINATQRRIARALINNEQYDKAAEMLKEIIASDHSSSKAQSRAISDYAFLLATRPDPDYYSAADQYQIIAENDDCMTSQGYWAWAYASFLVVNKEVMSAFRLKLDFYETGEVFYTTDYTLKRTSIGNESSYRIMPGTWYY